MLAIELPWLDEIVRPTVRRRLPVVLSADEVSALLSRFTGHYAVLGKLLYGTGMRINEALQLRVKDIDFAHKAIVIREAKGFKDRVVMLPNTLTKPLRAQLAHARAVWTADNAVSRPGVFMPHALEKNIPMQERRWLGFGCSRKQTCRLIRVPVSSGVIISTIRPFSASLSARLSQQKSSNLQRPTHCAIPLRPICFNRATTFAACRNCWAIQV